MNEFYMFISLRYGHLPPIRKKLYELDGPDMRDTTREVGTNS